jgi:hypothetical protein
MPEGSPGAGALKCGSSYYYMEIKLDFAALSCHMGKCSRVIRYVIIKSFVHNQAIIGQRNAGSIGIFVQNCSVLPEL